MIYHFIAFFLMILILTGCGDSNADKIEIDHNNKMILVSNGKKGEVFQRHFQDAQKFNTKYRSGIKCIEEKKYGEALVLLEEAYNLADNRSFQGMALVKMAEVYEAIEDYEFAANFYEAVSKTTMNQEDAKNMLAKAEEMRIKWRRQVKDADLSANE